MIEALWNWLMDWAYNAFGIANLKQLFDFLTGKTE